MRGVRKKRRRRGEEEWLRFHYILYMSKMPGRLLPASLSAPCWMCVCTCTHSSVVFTLSLTFSCRKKNYLSGFQVFKMDLSHRVARGRSHEPQLHREMQKGVKRKEEERLANMCVIHLQSFIPSPVLGINCCFIQHLWHHGSCDIHGNER